jgi:hypothetical protein
VVYPTLVLQAGGADLGLEFGDRTRPQDSASLTGRGALFGVGADLAAPLCAGCPWLAFAGFRYQWLPETEVDRDPRLVLGVAPGGPGSSQSVFDVLADETRLRREAREISARLAYGLPGARVLPFAGVRHRWTEVRIEDELAFRSSLGETRLETRTRLEAEPTLGLAGFDFQLGPRLFGSFETSVGEEDYGAALRMVALLQGPEVPLPGPPDGQSRRARRIADALAPRMAQIEAEFLAGRAALTLTVGPNGEPAYFVAEVKALLERTEAALLAALRQYPELEALGYWVREQFTAARALLAQASSPPRQGAGSARPSRAVASFVPARPTATALQAPFRQNLDLALAALPRPSMQLAQGPSAATVPQAATAAPLALGHDAVALPRQRMENDRLMTWVVFTTTLSLDTRLIIFPRYSQKGRRGLPTNEAGDPDPQGEWLPAGSYAYYLLPGSEKLNCDPIDPSTQTCPLDLVRRKALILCCSDRGCRPNQCL